MQQRELVWRVRGFGDKLKGRRSSNLLAQFGDKTIKKAKGWKASLQDRFSVVGNTHERSGSLPEAGTTPTSEQEKTQQFSTTPLKVDHTPTFSEATLPRGLAQMLSSGTLVGGRHSVVSTGVIPEEGFEEA